MTRLKLRVKCRVASVILLLYGLLQKQYSRCMEKYTYEKNDRNNVTKPRLQPYDATYIAI